MGLQINTNVAALNAYRNLTGTQGSMQTSLERLSSGLRINRAADDAAGLAISEKLRSQVNGLNQAQANAQDGVSLIQTAEGALNEVHSILQRMRSLAVQSASDTNTVEDRKAIQAEINTLYTEIDDTANRTQFNGMKLLDGNFDGKLQIGANSGQTMDVKIQAMTTSGFKLDQVDTVGTPGAVGTITTAATDSPAATVSDPLGKLAAGTWEIAGNTIVDTNDVVVGSWSSGTNTATFAGGGSVSFTNATFADGDTFVTTAGTTGASTAKIDLTTAESSSAAIDALDTAIETVSTQRAALGALQNRLQHTVANLGVSAENLAASESRIRDTDMAKEMTNFSRSQILQQAGVSMLAQANQASQSVLKLLG